MGTATTDRIVVAPRFNGPPASANGGYACGLVARRVDGPAEVSRRLPVPLDRPLEAERHDDGRVTLHDGDALLAEGGPALPLDFEPPYRPSLVEAQAAASQPFAGFGGVFGQCYVCSPDRPDGLGVNFGRLEADPDMTAALLLARDDLAGADGAVATEIAWAALDCPSYTPELWNAGQPSLLARLTAELLEPLPAGEPLVVVGWTLAREGRKLHSASALLSADGRTLGLAQALWVQLRPAA